MKANVQLFEFIQSLSKKEKRFIKLHTSNYQKSESKKIVQLFSAIIRSKSTDESKIKSQISDEAILKNFAFYKHNLKVNVLKCLSDFYSYEYPELELEEQRCQIAILIGKQHYKQASVLIKKAKSKAIRYELYHIASLLNLQQQQILEQFQVESTDFEKQLSLCTENIAFRERTLIHEKVKLFYHKITQIKLDSYLSWNGKCSAAKRIATHPILNHKDDRLPIKTKTLIFSIKAIYANFGGATEFLVPYGASILKTFEQNKKLLRSNFAEYINFYNHYIQVLLHCKLVERAADEIELFKKSITNSSDSFMQSNKALVDLLTESLLLRLLFDTQKTDIIVGGNWKFQNKSAIRLSPCQLGENIDVLSRAYFTEKKYEKCLEVVFAVESQSLTFNVQSNGLLMRLLCLIELKRNKLISSNLTRFYRLLQSRNKYSMLEKSIISFIRKLNKNHFTEEEMYQQFLEIRLDIQKYKDQKSQLFFIFDSWLQTRLEVQKSLAKPSAT